jgi:hypothetical protein
MEFSAYEWFYSNVGTANLQGSDAYEWLYTNIDATQPNPFFVGSTPIRAYAGETVTVIGRGIGETPDQYIPQIQGLTWDGTWLPLQYTSFTYVPPSANAYTADRTISSDYSTVDPGHTRLTFIVPEWATDPFFTMRLVASDTNVVQAISRTADEWLFSNVTS